MKNRLEVLRGDMSQREMAEKLGMSKQNYWYYENGAKGMKSDLIEKVCGIFGCSAEWLLGFDDDVDEGMESVCSIYRSLNDDGKEYLRRQADFAATVPEYKKRDSVPERLDA